MEFQGKCSVLSLLGYLEDSQCMIGIIYFGLLEYWSRGSSVGIVAGYRLDGQGIRVPFQTGARDFLFHTASRLALGPTQHPIEWVPWVFPPRGKEPRCERDHPDSSSAES
jgi:hypothetical protein